MNDYEAMNHGSNLVISCGCNSLAEINHPTGYVQTNIFRLLCGSSQVVVCLIFQNHNTLFYLNQIFEVLGRLLYIAPPVPA
jgi:hypothetical protein